MMERTKPWSKIVSWEKKGKSLLLIGSEDLKIEVINEKIIRFHFSKNKAWRHNYSFAIEKELPKIDFTVEEKEENIILSTEILKVVINKNIPNIKIYTKEDELIHSDYKNYGYAKYKDKVFSFKNFEKEEAFLGLGEKMGGLNKKGKKYINWNTDDPHHYPHTDPLYQSHPFFLAWNSEFSYGIFFDNTFRTYFNLGEESSKYYYFYADNGELDYYFIYGPTPKEVIENYTLLTGRYYMPPLFALGYQQSKWGYKNKEMLMDIARKFREKDIPCDVLYMDIDHMDGFRVFTFDEERFPNIKNMIEDLNNMGFKIVPIVDPGVKKDINYEIYREGVEKDFFCRRSTGEIYVGYVWPGECAFPDFTKKEVRDWWGEKQKRLTEAGVSGIWNDMNEPSSFSHPMDIFSRSWERHNTFWGIFSDHNDEIFYDKTFPKDVVHGEKGEFTHDEIHNVYGLLMAKASYEGWRRENPNVRPLIITRAGFSGVQKYSAVWTGDNKSWWEHLYISIPMLQNLGISGVPFIGADVGGFGLDSSPELFVRWIELGIFYPFFRNHSELNTRSQEPWAFSKEVEEISKEYIKLRYRLIPYFYSLFWEAKEKGIPLIRSLILEFPNDKEAIHNYDEFLLGPFILVAPIYQEGVRARVVYLPEGLWYDFWEGKVYKGPDYISIKAPLDKIPIFIREGSIIPLWEPQNYIGEKKQETLEILIYPGKGEFTYYEDDGISWDYEKGIYNLIKFKIDERSFEIKYIHKEYNSDRKWFKVRYLDKEFVIEDKDHIKIKL
ncbi:MULTISPECIES: glycoside hydrolase family 31 protein [Dictyoglomus]|jgi:alpha-glucosidase|uniref:glycoside hydrolase family 31 protein n=1 Tax=Dictyoglomus TaxID=13 RepID=UPI0023538E69|nr:glycoside hydrolase family 31 protein [Dictyoglomus turgidum]